MQGSFSHLYRQAQNFAPSRRSFHMHGHMFHEWYPSHLQAMHEISRGCHMITASFPSWPSCSLSKVAMNMTLRNAWNEKLQSRNLGSSSSESFVSDLTSSLRFLSFSFSFFALSFSARSFAFFSFSSAVSGAFQALSESYIYIYILINRKIIQDNVHGES